MKTSFLTLLAACTAFAADGFSFAGKTITLNVSGALDKRNTYVLATGTTGITSVSNELPTVWKLSAGNNSLKFC